MLTPGEDGSPNRQHSGKRTNDKQPQDNSSVQQPPAEQEKPSAPGIPGLPDVGRALKGLFGG
jgi:hypothetical protein